jgi:hypothetical protein
MASLSDDNWSVSWITWPTIARYSPLRRGATLLTASSFTRCCRIGTLLFSFLESNQCRGAPSDEYDGSLTLGGDVLDVVKSFVES